MGSLKSAVARNYKAFGSVISGAYYCFFTLADLCICCHMNLSQIFLINIKSYFIYHQKYTPYVTFYRTNLPKEVMAYPGFPFPKHLPSFVVHKDVLQYLQDYAKHYDIEKFIKVGIFLS